MANKNFEVKHGLSVGGTERITSAGVGTFTDLNVTGTTTTIDTATLQVQDKNIVINYGSGDTSSTASGAGITIQDAVDASNDATILWDASADEFDFSHTVTAPSLTIAGNAAFDTSTLVVDSSNNRVGIGTASPSQSLHVDGIVASQNSSQGSGLLQLQGYGNTAYINHTGSDKLYFRMGSGFDTRMTLTTGGNLGIGTTSPVKFLDVGVPTNASAIDANIRLNTHYGTQNTARGGIQMFDGSNVTAQIDTRYDGSKVDMHFGSLYSGGYNTTSRMVITGSGNVGIGTTTPNQLLSVKGRISSDLNDDYYGAWLDGNSASSQDNFLGLGPWHNNAGYIKFIQSASPDRLSIYTTNTSDHVTLQEAGGNVGIGTTSPSTLLHINGSGDAIRVESTNAGAGGAQMDLLHFSASPADNDVHGVINFGGYYSGSSSAYGSSIKSIWTDVSSKEAKLEFYTRDDSDFTARMVIDKDGHVGISNTSPSAILHVGGDGVSVNTTLDVSRTAIFRTTGTGNYSSSGNNSAAHAATFMRGDTANTGDQIGHSYVFNNGGWSATAEIMAEVEDNSTAYSRLNFKTWRGGMATRQVITSEGYVQKAYQPYIRCAGNTASMASNQGTTQNPFNNWAVQTSRGITHSNGVFTCPIAGEYLVTYSFYNWMNNTGKGVTHAAYLKKGSTIVQETNNEFDMGDNSYSYYDNNLSNSLILDMAAGDTFQFEVYADIYGGTSHTNMSAYLLG